MGEISGSYYDWTEENTKNVPARAGVYAFYDANGTLIYIGSSSDIRERFRHYWSTDFEEDPCKRDTKKYKREFTEDYEEKEKELLEQYEHEHGKLPKCNKKRG